MKRNWPTSVITVIIGLAVLSLAGADFAASPANHRGITVGPLFFQLPATAPIAATGHAPPTKPGTSLPNQVNVSASGVVLKPDVRGLVNDGVMPPSSVLPYIHGMAVTVNWAALQQSATMNQQLVVVHPNQIDRMISAFQRSYPGMKIKIRVWTGRYTPAWALNLDGPSFKMNNYSCAVIPVPSGCNGGAQSQSYARWWGPNFQAAYDRLELALGAAYDRNTIVAEVSSPRCMTFWDESMVRTWDSWSMTNLLKAGYSVASDVACLEQQLTSQATAWPHTVVSFAVNVYRDYYWKSAGVPAWANDLANTSAVLTFCRQRLGKQCLLQNDELGRPTSFAANSHYDPIYPLLVKWGTPRAYMMDVPGFTAGVPLSSIFALAVSSGAGSLEVQPAYFLKSPPSFFALYDLELRHTPQ